MPKTATHKKAIALFITVMFIMLITVSIGVGLKYINISSKSVNDENFVLQNFIILSDVLHILKNSSLLSKINSPEELSFFLSESSFIPLQSNGTEIIIEVRSARSKINPNIFLDNSKIEALKNYFITKSANIEYINMFLDIIGGIKEDMSYNSGIFAQKPYLFRDYISSYKHLEEISDSYMKSYHDDSFKKINMQELFYISKDKTTSVDLNYATQSVWELMLGCDEERAKMLSIYGGTRTSLDELELTSEEKVSLSRFKTSFFEPYLDVNIKTMQKDKSSNIRFEYDIKLKKGYNFAYEVY